MRTLAIGDIHGMATSLDALLEAVQPTADDQLVFLGDYVDRGPDSKGVIDRLIALRQQFPKTICLRGNHEIMMAQARVSKSDNRIWQSVGGREALASYAKHSRLPGSLNDVPESHWMFIEETCIDYYETETHIFVHAGVQPNLPMNEQDEGSLFWEFLKEPIQHYSGKTIICGHTSQRSGEVLDYGSTICIDTHAYAGQYLTCLDVDERRTWQVDLLGRVKEDWLKH